MTSDRRIHHNNTFDENISISNCETVRQSGPEASSGGPQLSPLGDETYVHVSRENFKLILRAQALLKAAIDLFPDGANALSDGEDEKILAVLMAADELMDVLEPS
ncbi:hypothetical protein [Roseobacter sp. AzwK-3b]|uniref:hypothetical protein n=1 Tax=Roseobacter sp. AzwK-3b TaxID=351016 RepID=UPI0012F4D1BC|nr:hypothetical protein [Roseobacter sp. AzwK-3b]